MHNLSIVGTNTKGWGVVGSVPKTKGWVEARRICLVKLSKSHSNWLQCTLIDDGK